MLPNLENSPDAVNVRENLRNVQLLYLAAMLEELKAFNAIDELVALFLSGMLPNSRGHVTENLFMNWKNISNRVSENERHTLYARVLGITPGQDQCRSNREFRGLWRCFISEVIGTRAKFAATKPLLWGVTDQQ